MRIGTRCADDRSCEFVVWAPRRQSVALKLLENGIERIIPMTRDDRGYWKAVASETGHGARYLYRLDDHTERPDPASRFQPDGVHAPSQVVDQKTYAWHDQDWPGIPLRDTIQYELHVGTFTPDGTFDAAIPRLADLKALGITSIEIMPVAQFPGSRNWGYDGAYPYAVQNSYGGPHALKRFVDAAHQLGLSVILDVVYNHLGPEGNYLHDFAPYFTDKYKTPWGWAINFDGPESDHVREYFIENALMWFRDYHVDALRLDAIHGIFDFSARPFLLVLQERVEALAAESGRNCDLIAESDLNDTRVIRPREQGGFGLPAQWSDDFHHALHTLLTGEASGYYEDFGRLEDLATAMRDGFVYAGRPSRHRRRSHGNDSADIPADRFVIFAQNHDQIGNRMNGDRLSSTLSFEAIKLAAGALLLAPNIPLLFMGEEYCEDNPFLYFVSHTDPDLVAAVRNGRKEEFRSFGWAAEPPDPQSEETYHRSKLDWSKRDQGKHRLLLDFHTQLISWRRALPALAVPAKNDLIVNSYDDPRLITCRRKFLNSEAFTLLAFAADEVAAAIDPPDGRFRKVLDSADARWGGPGSCLPEILPADGKLMITPRTFTLYVKEDNE